MTTEDLESIKKRIGKVYLVGAGPGDPGLITIKGRNVLAKAEVIVYDYLANKKLLKYVPADAEFIYAGKKGGSKHTHTQAEINQMLIDHALAGKIVVRLKGGDPFIFGRGGEEIEELFDAGVPFEVVPGVTSATAAATYAGVPITHREYTSSVAFITGHEDPTKPNTNIAWDKISTGIGTLVFYMGIKNLPSISEKLIENGRDPKTPVLVVRWASTPEQRSVVGTLENIAALVKEKDIKPPALVVVGDVVKLRDKINWFENKPLFGKKILVTRTRDQASELVELLEEAGANCLEGATIALEPPENWDELDRGLAKMNHYQWLLFTSINAIKYFFQRLHEKGMDARDLKGPKIGVVGIATAEILLSYGIKADLLPREFTGEGLAESLIESGVSGGKIFLPRALDAREVLPESLREAGAEVDVAPVYRNVRPEGYEDVRQELEANQISVITFTSSSTVKNFLRMIDAKDEHELQKLLAGVKIAVIGPITAKTAIANGLEVHIQPQTYTIPALVDEIVSYYA
ncbi:MAG: uroporphyrinogen-III C-methyltransferase [Proteobacteria bacterium]|nr:uroporphyrinogen-III C-methyltransferase [Pseudomonadota bacterium]MBU1714744.1 uroporphyrinogen-III C-methyltransferase [Pseudomonadota bacterium]